VPRWARSAPAISITSWRPRIASRSAATNSEIPRVGDRLFPRRDELWNDEQRIGTMRIGPVREEVAEPDRLELDRVLLAVDQLLAVDAVAEDRRDRVEKVGGRGDVAEGRRVGLARRDVHLGRAWCAVPRTTNVVASRSPASAA